MAVLDPNMLKPFGEASSMKYLIGHKMNRALFLERVRKEDRDIDEEEIIADNTPLYASFLFNNYECPENIKIERVKGIISTDGVSTIIIGSRGAGKTCASIWIAEKLLNEGRKVYWYGYNEGLEKEYPEIMQNFDWHSFKEGTIIFDEAAMYMSARESMTIEARERVKNFATIRHKDQSLIYIVQNIMDLDVSCFRNSTLIWFKSTPLSNMFERREKDIKIPLLFKYIIPQISKIQYKLNAIYNKETDEVITFENDKPRNWTEEISKPYKNVDAEKAIKIFFQMQEDNIPIKIISTALTGYGWPLHKLQPYLQTENLKIPVCPRCNSINYQNWGTRDGLQRYKCNSCGHTFQEKS